MNKSFLFNNLIFLFFLCLLLNNFNNITFISGSGFYLSLISIIYYFLFSFIFNNSGSIYIGFLILVSVTSSIVCFTTDNLLYFWLSYELAILPLLLLILFWSSYSDRIKASWYLIGYISFTSLPMLLFFIYCYLINGSLLISLNENFNNSFFYLLAIIFITKIPFPPFHSWLPVVHAEASSLVSMALSGYIMKLGLIGLVRFCYSWNPNIFFFYFLSCFYFSLCFFFNALHELDYKRWLAFLSLVHIQIVGVGFLINSLDSQSLIFVYSLGHGLSAILLFYIFDNFSFIVGSRNWLFLSNISNNSYFWYFFISSSLLTASSFPSTLQFFSEVNIVCNSLGFSLLVLFLALYLLFGGLVPTILLAQSYSNSKFLTNSVDISKLFYLVLLLLNFFCYVGIFIV
nr:NADH dehydrogenase subunit 4 [Rhabdosynochus viridisi]